MKCSFWHHCQSQTKQSISHTFLSFPFPLLATSAFSQFRDHGSNCHRHHHQQQQQQHHHHLNHHICSHRIYLGGLLYHQTRCSLQTTNPCIFQIPTDWRTMLGAAPSWMPALGKHWARVELYRDTNAYSTNNYSQMAPPAHELPTIVAPQKQPPKSFYVWTLCFCQSTTIKVYHGSNI